MYTHPFCWVYFSPTIRQKAGKTSYIFTIWPSDKIFCYHTVLFERIQTGNIDFINNSTKMTQLILVKCDSQLVQKVPMGRNVYHSVPTAWTSTVMLSMGLVLMGAVRAGLGPLVIRVSIRLKINSSFYILVKYNLLLYHINELNCFSWKIHTINIL